MQNNCDDDTKTGRRPRQRHIMVVGFHSGRLLNLLCPHSRPGIDKLVKRERKTKELCCLLTSFSYSLHFKRLTPEKFTIFKYNYAFDESAKGCCVCVPTQ